MADEHERQVPDDDAEKRGPRTDPQSRREEPQDEPSDRVEGRDRAPSTPERDRTDPWLGGG